MREAWKKILLAFFAVLLVMPAVFFTRPEKAEGLVSLSACFAAKGIASGTALAKVAPGLVTSVSVVNPTGSSAAASDAAGNDWTACFLKSLTKIIAKTLLHTFTQSIVNWINTGFQGSPSFITNPEGFLSDVVDQTVGKVIQDISPLLCAPFRLNIKFALGLNASLRTKQEVTCRLSNVIANVQGAYDGFVQGTIGSGNLSQWVHIAGTQSNNPYGAYIGVTDIMSASITTATGQQIKLLDWGKGFKSWRSCEQWGPDVVVAGKATRKGPCIKEGPIKTPGSIIEAQTTGALATTFQELELANEIDEVVGALINQLLVKAVTGAGGLLGASKGSVTDGGQSATSQLLTNPNAALVKVDAKTPNGIDCHLRYYPATKETFSGSGFYIPDESRSDVYTDNLDPLTSLAVPLKIAASRSPYTNWNDYFAAVKAGCANEWNTLIDAAGKSGQDSYNRGGNSVSSGQNQQTPTSNTQTLSGNIAQGKLVMQSSIYGNDWRRYGPQILTNGDTLGDSTFGTAFTAEDYSQKWFVIDLESQSRSQPAGTGETRLSGTEISEMKIYGPTDSWASPEYGAYNSTRPFIVYITAEDPTVVDVRTLTNPAYKGYFYLEQRPTNNSTIHEVTYDATEKKVTSDKVVSSIKPANAPIKARYITIVSPPVEVFGRTTYFRYFGFTEVEVIGKQTRTDGTGGSSTQPSIPFSFTTLPAQITLRKPTDWNVGNMFTWDNRTGDTTVGINHKPITFTPNQPQEGITFRARYYSCNPSGTSSTMPATCNVNDYKLDRFLTGMNSLNITYRVDNIQTTKVMMTEGGGHYNTENAGVPADGPEDGILFAKNLSIRNTDPIQITLQGSQRCNSVSCSGVPFRIVIDALDSHSTPVGTVKADFATQ